MPIRGEGLRKVLLVSEREWHEKHFMLDRLVARSGGLDKSHFYFCDLTDQHHIREFIQAHDIKTVVTLGEPVLNRLVGEKDILRWRGRVLDFAGVQLIPTFAPHKLLPENPNAKQVALERMRGITQLTNPPRFQGVWMLDVEEAVRIARDGWKGRRKASYLVDPTPEEFGKWVDAYLALLASGLTPYLSWDIETVYKAKKRNEDDLEEDELDLAEGTILRVSFAYEEATGVTVPWSPPYLAAIQSLLGSAGPKVVWNGITFDVPVVEANGMRVNGAIHDGMDAWHVYQSDLPKGLEFVSSFTSDLLPWKHLNNADPGLYSAIDADAALRNMNWIETKLRSTGQWDLYFNLYHRVMVPLTAANKRGCYIDIEKRDALKEEMSVLMAAKVAELQPLVPQEVKPRKRYKRRPWEGDDPSVHHEVTEGYYFWMGGEGEADRYFEPVTVQGPVKFCTHCGARDVKKGDHFKGGKRPVVDPVHGYQVFDKKGKPVMRVVKNPCKEAGATIEVRPADVVEWDEILPFNPNSTDQLMAYARHFGHPIGTNAKDSTKEAFDSSHIKELLTTIKAETHQTFYTKVLEIKKLAKTLGTYIYNPDSEGLIHQTYKNAPSTPRLSGANKNLMNVGKREDNYWATRAREQLIARPGHRYVQADSSAIEAVIQGWWMGDENYMRLATQSVHAFVVARQHGIEWTGTPEQVDYLKANFKDAYNKMKTANYLTNFGGSPYLMWKTDRKSFPTKAAAEATQAMLFAELPKLPQYHHWVRAKAQKEGFLEIPGWKFRHYYYDVFTTDGNTGKVKYGKDSKKVVALYPQGCAALFLRENSLLIAYGDVAAEWLGIEPLGLSRGYMEWMPANFAVHDGYTLEVPDGCEDEAMDVLERVLTRPIKHLNGLRVGCEIDVSPVGGNWGTYHPVKNPMGLKTVKTVRVEVVPPPAFVRAA